MRIAEKSRTCTFEKWNFTGGSIKSRDTIASSAFYLYVYGIDRSLCALLTSSQRSKRRNWFARPVDTSALGTIAIPSTVTWRSCRQITSNGIKIAFTQPRNTYGIVWEHESTSIAEYMAYLEELQEAAYADCIILGIWFSMKRNLCVEEMISDTVLKLALNQGKFAYERMVS